MPRLDARGELRWERGEYVRPCFGCGRPLRYAGAGAPRVVCGRKRCEAYRHWWLRKHGRAEKRRPCVCQWCGHQHRARPSDSA